MFCFSFKIHIFFLIWSWTKMMRLFTWLLYSAHHTNFNEKNATNSNLFTILTIRPVQHVEKIKLIDTVESIFSQSFRPKCHELSFQIKMNLFCCIFRMVCSFHAWWLSIFACTVFIKTFFSHSCFPVFDLGQANEHWKVYLAGKNNTFEIEPRIVQTVGGLVNFFLVYIFSMECGYDMDVWNVKYGRSLDFLIKLNPTFSWEILMRLFFKNFHRKIHAMQSDTHAKWVNI